MKKQLLLLFSIFLLGNQFINAQRTATLAPVQTFRNGYARDVTSVRLSDNKVLVGYKDASSSTTGDFYTVIGTVTGTSISWGTPQLTITNNVLKARLIQVTSEKAVLMYEHNASPDVMKSIVLSISGATISVGTPVNIGSDGYDIGHFGSFKGIALSNDLIVIAYEAVLPTYQMVMYAGTISGSAISWGTKTLGAQNISYVSLVRMTDSKFALAYEWNDGTSGGDGVILAGTVSGTTISLGTPQIYESALTTATVSLARLSDTELAVAFEDESTDEGRLFYATLSGTTFNFPGSHTNFFSGKNIEDMVITPISATEIAIAINGTTASLSQFLTAERSGNNFNLSAITQIIAGNADEIMPVGLNSDKFFISYTDDDNVNGVIDERGDAHILTMSSGTNPEINLQGNAADIVSGDSSPGTGDHTDFGTGAGLTRTFTIQNTGSGTLTLGSNAVSVSGTNSSEFVVTTQPATSVAGGGSTTFIVTFTSAVTSTRSAILHINNDDVHEYNYHYNVQGVGSSANAIPTLTTLASPVVTGVEDTEKEILFSDLNTAGDEADSDGTVDAYYVKAVSTGALKIGTNSGTAIAFNATTNKTITSTLKAYWTPASGANGTLNMFMVVAVDDDAAESAIPVQAKASMSDVNDIPTLTTIASPVVTGFEDTEKEILYSDLNIAGDEADSDGTVDAYYVKAVSTGTLKIGTNSGTAIAFNATTNKTISSTLKAYWTPASGANGTLNMFMVVVVDDDAAESATPIQAQISISAKPTVAFSITTSDGLESVTVASLEVNLNAASAQTITVDYAVSGTATATDYTLINGTLTFTPGQTSNSITIASIVGDLLDEDNETVIVTLSNPGNSTLGTNTVHTYTITDDDDAPTVTLGLSGSPFAENAGVATITASLNTVSGKTVTVTIGATGTATGSGVDYTLSSTTITITAGATSGTATITGVGDALDEDTETVIIDITSVTNGNESGTQQVTAAITDDDDAPTVTLGLSGSPLAENAGVGTITATLNAVSGKNVIVTIDPSGTAVGSGVDYTLSSTTITINAGSISGTATVTGADDATPEGNETVIIDITGVSNGTESGTQQVTATITDDDYTNPTITFSNVNKTYGNANFDLGATSNSTGAITYTIEGVNTTGTTLSGTNNSTVNLGNAGSLTIRATITANGIYSSGTKDILLTISKATITATADNKAKVYGNANPAFTISYSGFKNGDTTAVLTAVPTASTTATVTTSVGNAFITLSGGSATNYTVNTVIGILTIGKATITTTADDKSRVYGDANPTFTISYSGFKNGDTSADLTTEPTGSSIATPTTNVGTVDIDVSGGADDNYDFLYVKGTLTISSNTITWTGTTDNDWDKTSNWSTNTVPSTNSVITIPFSLTNYPTANNPVEFSNLTINSGASFIPQSTVTGTITYKRNIPDTNWHLVSSPVSGATYQDMIANHTFASGSAANIGISLYSNTIGSPWIYAQLGTSGIMTSGLGASVKLTAAGELSISGTANTSNVTKAITTGSRTDLNLIGNPFTSYVNAATFLNANTALLSEETIWLWNGTAYVTYNATNSIEIAPGQAFFVDAASNGNVTFATSNQSHQADTFMRPAAKTSFELFVENETSKKSTKVFYIADKTTGFDNGYDSKAFTDAKNDFDVFTELVSDNKGNKLAIQSLPNTDLDAIVVPVGITAKAGEEVTFSVNSQNFPSDVKIYLEDRIANTFTDISENSHKVVLVNVANGAGQFYIHTTSKDLEIASIQPELSKNVSIYKSENNSITISGLQTDNATLNVFSVLGQKIISKSFKSTGVSVIQLPKTSKGVYIIELNSDLGTVSKKIILE